MVSIGFLVRLSEEFIFQGHAIAAAPHGEVFQLKKSLKVAADLHLAPTRKVPQLTAAKKRVSLLEFLLGHLFTNEGFNFLQEASRLRGQLIKAAAKDFGGDLVGGFDVFQGDGEHFDFPPIDLVLDRFSLVLVQKRDGVDQGEVFFVVAAGSGSSAGEGEVTRKRIGDALGLDQALRVLHHSQDVFAFLVGKDSFDGPGLALEFMDALGLLFGFINGEDKAAIHEFLVDVD